MRQRIGLHRSSVPIRDQHDQCPDWLMSPRSVSWFVMIDCRAPIFRCCPHSRHGQVWFICLFFFHSLVSAEGQKERAALFNSFLECAAHAASVLHRGGGLDVYLACKKTFLGHLSVLIHQHWTDEKLVRRVWLEPTTYNRSARESRHLFQLLHHALFLECHLLWMP